MRTIETSVHICVTPSILWHAITDHEALLRHTSFLHKVQVLKQTTDGVGTVRLCTLRNGKSFQETITVWEEGQRYCYQPDPRQLPFRWVEACWSIGERPDGSMLSYRLQYEPKSVLKDVVNYALLRTYGIWQIRKMMKSYAN